MHGETVKNLFITVYVIMLSVIQNNYVAPKKINVGFTSDGEESGRNINVGNTPAIRFQGRNVLIRTKKYRCSATGRGGPRGSG
jgi:hypothetical protein